MAEMEMEVVSTDKKEEKPDPPERRRSLVAELQQRVRGAKGFHDKAFKQMKEDMKAAYNGFNDREWDSNRYVANILQRHVQQRTAALYAKNPRPLARRRNRMDYRIWDGDEETLVQARMAVDMAMQQQLPPPLPAVQLLQD